jgi:hypothetical protein
MPTAMHLVMSQGVTLPAALAPNASLALTAEPTPNETELTRTMVR